MPRPLSLSDRQLLLIKEAAHTILPSARAAFLEGVARRLGSQPSDEALQHAISEALAVNRIPQFLCDAKPRKEISK
jgi:hypothetical protein